MEHVVKSWFTTLAGMVLITLSIYFWSLDQISDAGAISAGLVGFVFIWIKDKLSGWIEEIFRAWLKKFKSN